MDFLSSFKNSAKIQIFLTQMEHDTDHVTRNIGPPFFNNPILLKENIFFIFHHKSWMRFPPCPHEYDGPAFNAARYRGPFLVSKTSFFYMQSALHYSLPNRKSVEEITS